MSAAGDTDGSVHAHVASDADAAATAQDGPATGESVPHDTANGTTSKTRKRRKDFQESRPKRLKGHYRDEYRELYNSTIAEACNYSPEGNPGRLKPSQIGVSNWTVFEKQKLFGAIEKHGRNDLQKVTAIIETKSEPEVRDFLLLLRDGVVELHLNRKHHGQPALHEIPAAYELSEECCESLEAAGEVLSLYQHSWEAKQEQQKHGDHWLLTERIAADIDAAIEQDDHKNGLDDDSENLPDGAAPAEDAVEEEQEDDRERSQEALYAVPTAQLLRLSAWIGLSHRVFMNAGGDRADENRQSIAGPDEEVGIFQTAFTDFRRLAVSVTKRLVSVSLIQAASRIRATRRNHPPTPKPLVRRQDILAALDMLNMSRSAKRLLGQSTPALWVLVYEHGKIINYDEVERKLGVDTPAKATTTPMANANENLTQFDGISSDDAYTSDEDEVDDYSASEEQDPDALQDAYADLYDVQQSVQEERRLWKVLGRSPPSTMIPAEVDLPNRPSIDRKLGDDLVDWRDRVDYKAEWERYGEPIEKAKFEDANYKARQTLGAQSEGAGTARSGSYRRPPNTSAINGRSARNEALSSRQQEAQYAPESVALEQDIGDTAATSADEDNDDGENHSSNLPVRKVLAPRRARDAATSLMGVLPPFLEGDASSGDDYDAGSQHDSE